MDDEKDLEEGADLGADADELDPAADDDLTADVDPLDGDDDVADDEE